MHCQILPVSKPLYVKTVSLFICQQVPQSSSTLIKGTTWQVGTQYEFADPQQP